MLYKIGVFPSGLTVNLPEVEPIPAQAVPASPLAEFLGEAGAVDGLFAYRGVLTPQHLDAREAETGALLTGAAVHDLGWLRRIAVRGEDRERWLSGMVTNTVESLENHHGNYSLILNVQGRIQGDATVWHEDGELELEVTAAQCAAILAHLDRFIVMDDVELAVDTTLSALGVTGPRAGEVLQALGVTALPEEMASAWGEVAGVPARVNRGYGRVVPHYAVWVGTERVPEVWRALKGAGARAVGSEAVETLRIAEGIPEYGVEIESRDLPQETSQMRALHFTKGCYLGQEIVERIRSRGQVHRHLRHMELFPEAGSELPAAGAELFAGASGKAAGRIASLAVVQQSGKRRIFALGPVRAEAETGGEPLRYAGGEAVLLHAPPQFG